MPDSDKPVALFACLYEPPMPHAAQQASDPRDGAALCAIAQDFSPRFAIDRDDLVSIDVSGLTRLLGTPQTIGEELRRAAAERGRRVHVGVAGTRTAAMVLAQAHPGLTVVRRGEEAAALAPISIGLAPAAMPAAASAKRAADARHQRAGVGPRENVNNASDANDSALSVFRSWGIRTLGDLAALPAADLASRLGRAAVVWQAIARGEDVCPLVPALAEERFDCSLELEWPIEGLEPLSFVLTRLLEPLSTRLERRDRGAAVLHVLLRLVTREVYARRLELPTPVRDVRTLRTLALLDLESHPAPAAIDRVSIVIDPTPGRVLQHTLFTRAQPTPEQLSTLLARLGAVMGQDRIGAPATVDSYRPGAFAMSTFASDHDINRGDRRARREEHFSAISASPAVDRDTPASALRRCRQPVPARVVLEHDRPVRITTDRRGFTGGAVVRTAGPWRVSGEWWEMGQVRQVGQEGSACGHASGREGAADGELRRSVLDTREGYGPSVSGAGVGPRASKERPPRESNKSHNSHGAFNRDEWDVSLADGAVYVVFRDRETDRWFVDAIVD
jgi:protein ImuB